MIATVECFMANRGFGFLRTNEGQDFFFHVSHFKGKPRPGAVVSFELTDPVRRGLRPQAINIEILEDSPALEVLAGNSTTITEGGK